MIIHKIKRALRTRQTKKEFERQFADFKQEIRQRDYNSEIKEPKAAAILLSYARPANVPWIARALLQCDFVSKVIVSNNNPRIKIEDWFDFDDGRLELINQPARRRAGYRFEIARHMDDPYFIFLDDDLYMRPAQIESVYGKLLERPEIPHGVWGQRIVRAADGALELRDGQRNCNHPLEVINRAYFLSAEHVRVFFEILHHMGKEKITDLQFGDDIVLSFTGPGKPLCHDVGELLNCWSKDADGIALWKETSFFDYRKELYNTVESLRPDRDQINPSVRH